MVENKTNYKQTEIGLIPEDWEVVRLGEVAEIATGQSAPQGEEYFKNGKYPFIRVSHLSNEGYKIISYDLINDKAVKDYNLKIFPKDSIVFPKSGASIFLEKRAKLSFDAYTVSHLCVVNSSSNDLNQNFLFYTLINKKFAKDKDSNYPTLNINEIKSIQIPLPPLPEQKAIAEVLDKVRNVIEQTEEVIKATKELKKSLMKRLFTYGAVPVDEIDKVKLKETEIGLIPEYWEVVSLENVILLIQYGLSIRGNKEGKYPILRMNNLINGYISNTNLQYVDIDEETFYKFKVEKNDILFNRTNSLELVGKTAIFKLNRNCVFASYLIRIKTDKEKLIPDFLNFYLNWNETQKRLKLLATRGVSQSNISATKLKQFPISLPPISEQKQIAEILTKVDKKIEAEENKKQALEKLFKSLLNNLMTGKIRVNRNFLEKFKNDETT